jgi:hypothetical protein
MPNKKTKAQKLKLMMRRERKLRKRPNKNGFNSKRKVRSPRRTGARNRPQSSKHATGGNLGSVTVTDGLNAERVRVNDSMIEDRFSLRREKIADITGSTTAFSLSNQLFLNPGNTVMFPIFSQIAATYEQYRVNTLRFIFETESYTASGTNVTAGIVAMAVNFDPDDPNFTSLTQMENYVGSAKGPPYVVSMGYDVLRAHRIRRGKGGEKNDLPLKSYFVNSSANTLSPVTGAGKFYDMGNFQLAVANMVNSTSIIGELYVEYSFTMINPKQQTPLGQNLIAAHYNGVPVSTVAAFGSMNAVTTAGTLAPTFTGTVVTIPIAGRFLVLYNCNGATSSTTPTFTATTNCTLVGATTVDGVLAGTANNVISASSTAAAHTNSMVYNIVNCTAPNATITFTAPTLVGAGALDFWIIQIPGALNVTAKERAKEADDRLDRLEYMLSKLMRDDWRDSKLDLDYCNSRAPAIPLRTQDEDSKSVSSLRSQGLFRNK